MGRNKFSQHEIDIIGKLLERKNSGTRFQQKQIRHQLRVNFEFNISDFNEQGKAFGREELMAAKAAESVAAGETTDWQQAMKEWEEYEKNS